LLKLEAQIAQQSAPLSTTSCEILSKSEPNSSEQCNCVMLKGGLEDSKGVDFKEDGEANKALNKEKVMSLRL